ncbi:MAG: hypothetical protein A2287_05700 [Candidatus Melainabacteria bacterium RIFOXYA12_FULL_32_12]|nr:MAG: hypothetical protein A2255_07400 [Candidatus Melainabacteria bacterium RIFOXYA2_FULL_32_9]OGI30741.1 MAG: hypothetical protein A2287_05700 [Candidatus Melainabacteria bacterium RIFOXYA12_FULL_32_12]
MNIKVIKGDEAFLSLKDDWDRLAENLIAVTKFDWIYRWWNHFQEKNELSILIAEKNNKIVGIAPLYIENTKALKVVPFRKLKFLGGDLTDFLDFLIDEQDYNRELIFKNLLNYALNNFDYDLLELGQINSDYPNFDLWNKFAGYTGSKFTAYKENHKIKLAEFVSYQNYYRQLSKNHRKSLKSRLTKVINDGIDFKYEFKSHITEEDIEIIKKICIKRQNFLYKKGDHKRFCYFLDNKKTKFIEDYFCSNDNDSKMLAYLKFNGVIIAYNLILLNKNTFSIWNSTFDNDYEFYAPSKLFFNELIKYAFEKNYEYFDFMRGNDPYKLSWTNKTAYNYNFEYKKSLKAKLVFSYRENVPNFISKSIRNNELPDFEKLNL